MMPMDTNESILEEMKKKVNAGEYRYTIHALERCVERNISPIEVEEVMLSGEIIEDYPQDKYGPSCLIYGKTKTGRIIHVQCSIGPVWVITTYDPASAPEEWEEDFRRRRDKS
jgi:methanogenic corrinoid protein MtbC1